MLKAGKQLNTRHVGAVIEKPSKAGSNVETVAQGLPGRCCGYGKGAHGVRVIAQLDAAEEYCRFWESGALPTKAKNLQAGATLESSAHYQLYGRRLPARSDGMVETKEGEAVKGGDEKAEEEEDDDEKEKGALLPATPEKTDAPADSDTPAGVEQTGEAAIGRASVFVQVIGASQDHTISAAAAAAASEGVDLRGLCVPRRVRAAALAGSGVTAGAERGAPNGLPDIVDDVVAVKDWLEGQPGVALLRSFVGRDDTNSLTRRAFLNKIERLFEEPGPVFVTYYAGHGSSDGGKLCMQDGYVRFEDVVALWEERLLAAASSEELRFVLIADSCHSGSLVTALKDYERARKDERSARPLRMAVQAACRAGELSTGGCFTSGFIRKQDGKNFDWARFVEKPAACRVCRAFYQEGCDFCAVLHDQYHCAKDTSEVQHPDFYATWGEGELIDPGGFRMRLFRRAP